ncbi:MAG TPA: RNB domain-containing ribonuclease [Candidatus Nanoarchaeia archaeon]|nr:RNB domain-containing ribonuclease [Candidatus Nanoarchaeia archaeon]
MEEFEHFISEGKLIDGVFRDREEAFGLTIDGPDSLDLDDAIWLERRDDGSIVHVSIADVGGIVKKESSADEKAFKRSFTRYYENGNNPMLPRKLSEDLLSLREGERRPTITFSIPVSDRLEIGTPSIKRTCIQSKRKLSYQGFEDLMKDQSFEHVGMLQEASLLAWKLLQLRRVKGALAFFDLSYGLATSEEGALRKLDPDEACNAYLLIQEFMILANQSIALYLADQGVPILYRNHIARAIAPEREVLLNDLEVILMEAESRRAGTFQKKMSLVLERAFCSPTIAGHYALNLPVYAHFTSPIRRYADLVNHRQLVAFLMGEERPYTADQLFEISKHLNAVEGKIKDRKKIGFIIEREADTRRTIQENAFRDLDDGRFYEVLKFAAKEKKFVPQLEEEIDLRLSQDRIEARDFHLLLLGTPKESLLEIKQRIMDYLVLNPSEAAAILMIAHQSLGYSRPVYNSTEEWDDGSYFKSNVEISFSGKTYTSGVSRSVNKKLSEQLAAVSLLSRITGIDVSLVNELHKGGGGEPEINGERGNLEGRVLTGNYKGILQEACNKNRWRNPVYSLAVSGESHRPEFRVIAEIECNGKSYQSDPGVGPSRKYAEQLAAANLLQKLGESEHLQQDPPEVLVYGGDYVSALNTLIQRRHTGRPTYLIYEKKGETPEFDCDCSLRISGEERKYTGWGGDRKTARQEASRLAFEDLSQMMAGSSFKET